MTTASRDRSTMLKNLIGELLDDMLELPPGWVADRETWNLGNGTYVIHLDLQFSGDHYSYYSGIKLEPVVPDIQDSRSCRQLLRVPPSRRIKVEESDSTNDVAARVNKSLKTFIPVLDQYMVVYTAKRAEIEAKKSEKDRLVREAEEYLGPMPEGCRLVILTGGVYDLSFMTNDLKKVAAVVKALR